MKKLLICFLCLATLHSAPPKVVVFDYGGVIAKIDRRPVLHFIAESLDVPYKKVKKDFEKENFYKSFKKPPSFWENYGNKSTTQEWFETFEILQKEIVHPIEGMIEVINAIKSQGIDVALLSNCEKERAQFLDHLGCYAPFCPIILSCDVNAKKPSPKIYEALLNATGRNPSECLFIDNRKSNVKGGRKLGIDSITFKSIEKLKDDLKKREIDL